MDQRVTAARKSGREAPGREASGREAFPEGGPEREAQSAGSSVASTASGASAAPLFAEAVAIMERLRGPGGCPWDREQTFESITKYTLEEAYEVFDAIERRDWPELRDELGDLLLQVLFYAQMAAEPGYFDIADVIATLNRKLIRRHPHVFGDAASAAAGNSAQAPLETEGIDAAQVLRNWDAIKQAEKAQVPAGGSASTLDTVPRAMPALLEAAKLGSRAAKQGFDWPDVQGLFDKLNEETRELQDAIAAARSGASDDGSLQRAVTAEVGDLLFTVVNLARHLHVDPECALRGTNTRFRRRFAAMEAASPAPLETRSAAELEALWSSAKQVEAVGQASEIQ